VAVGAVKSDMLWLWERWKVTYCGCGSGENWHAVAVRAVKAEVLWCWERWKVIYWSSGSGTNWYFGSGPVLVLPSLCHHRLCIGYSIFSKSVESRSDHRLHWLSFRDFPQGLGHHRFLLNSFQFIIIDPHSSFKAICSKLLIAPCKKVLNEIEWKCFSRPPFLKY
jgi:hypothetical protein